MTACCFELQEASLETSFLTASARKYIDVAARHQSGKLDFNQNKLACSAWSLGRIRCKIDASNIGFALFRRHCSDKEEIEQKTSDLPKPENCGIQTERSATSIGYPGDLSHSFLVYINFVHRQTSIQNVRACNT